MRFIKFKSEAKVEPNKCSTLICNDVCKVKSFISSNSSHLADRVFLENKTKGVC